MSALDEGKVLEREMHSAKLRHKYGGIVEDEKAIEWADRLASIIAKIEAQGAGQEPELAEVIADLEYTQGFLLDHDIKVVYLKRAIAALKAYASPISIRNAALEEAAKVCETGWPDMPVRRTDAKNIRALQSTPHQEDKG